MKEYKNLHGFTVLETYPLTELGGTYVKMEHSKTGAMLYYLDRPDKNKTFAIGFRTAPTDDTGVFHIIEHSVLCGSESFPVKDPLTELLKGSLSTYLNALTYGEKTVYPISSMNDKAFLDLTRVYLDAVFCPRVRTDKNIFLQEGIRIEPDGEGGYRYNGIVYNEMKGAYSSPDEYISYLARTRLFPNGCYGYESGGMPRAIRELTYESLLLAHGKYYHPSNSMIFLDGEVDLDKTLALICSYLDRYERSECYHDVPLGDEPVTDTLTAEYPTEEGDEGEIRIRLSTRLPSPVSREDMLALSLITDVLSGSNNSPLKKQILDTGMCQNFNLYLMSGERYPTLHASFSGVSEGKEEELIPFFMSAIGSILDAGIERRSLEAALASAEFRTREADYGTYPKGMVYMSSVFDDVTAGLDPKDGLCYDGLFGCMRERLDSDYYLTVMRRCMLDTEWTCVILYPSESMAEREIREERSALNERLAKMSAEELNRINDEYASLIEWQTAPDTPEAIDSIPTLTLDDLDPDVKDIPHRTEKLSGTEAIFHDMDTGGITYIDMYFDASDIAPEDIPYLSLMTMIYRDLDTESGTAMEFTEKRKLSMGELRLSVLPFKKDGEGKLYLSLSASCLDSKRNEAVKLIREYLLTADFYTEGAIKKRIAQLYLSAKDSLSESALSFAMMRGAARYDVLESLNERIVGFEFLGLISHLAENADESALADKLSGLRGGLVTRERLTVSVSGRDIGDMPVALAEIITEGGAPSGRCRVTPTERCDEGIAISSGVSYATVTTNLISEAGVTPGGALSVLSSIATNEYLWGEIRVKGGAYGTGYVTRRNSGSVIAYSYRDPSPESSLIVYKKITDAVREYLDTVPDVTRHIIGTVGSLDTVTTPRSDATSMNTLYLSGKSLDDVRRMRREIIGATKDELRRWTELIDAAMESATVTVAGPKSKLSEMGIDKILEI